MITKGTKVRITTNNGGDITAILLENHRFTYDALIDVNGHAFRIIQSRIKTINPVE
jgi:hypothetical protein